MQTSCPRLLETCALPNFRLHPLWFRCFCDWHTAAMSQSFLVEAYSLALRRDDSPSGGMTLDIIIYLKLHELVEMHWECSTDMGIESLPCRMAGWLRTLCYVSVSHSATVSTSHSARELLHCSGGIPMVLCTAF